jgi:hypothetical protein
MLGNFAKAVPNGQVTNLIHWGSDTDKSNSCKESGAEWSAMITLDFSWSFQQQDITRGLPANTDTSDLFVLISWATGTEEQSAEVDLARGVQVSFPAWQCNASAIYTKNLTVFQPTVIVQSSIGRGTKPSLATAFRTMKLPAGFGPGTSLDLQIPNFAKSAFLRTSSSLITQGVFVQKTCPGGIVLAADAIAKNPAAPVPIASNATSWNLTLTSGPVDAAIVFNLSI